MLKIVFFGSDSWVIPVLQTLNDKFEIVAVVTAPNSAVFNYSSTDIPTFTPNKLDNLKFEIRNLKFDMGVVASYGKIIPGDVLEIPSFGFLNIHPSLLPKYRGASPVPQTILNGDSETGVTIIKMDSKMDHGPIVSTKLISLSGQENFTTLINKLFRAGVDLLIDIIPSFLEGKMELTHQDDKLATFSKRMKKEDGFFDLPAGRQELTPSEKEKLDRMIRAYTPWPGVWTKWNGKIVKFFPDRRVQMEGKKILSWNDFLNGYPNFPKTIF